MGITAAMEVWEPLPDAEQGEATAATEASMGVPEMESSEGGDPPTSVSASASALNFCTRPAGGTSFRLQLGWT